MRWWWWWGGGCRRSVVAAETLGAARKHLNPSPGCEEQQDAAAGQVKLKVISRRVECYHICLEEEKNTPVLSEGRPVKGGGTRGTHLQWRR